MDRQMNDRYKILHCQSLACPCQSNLINPPSLLGLLLEPNMVYSIPVTARLMHVIKAVGRLRKAYELTG